ncbi:cytochrome c-type biogenesis protein [Rubellimicrobium sp. CFH 75288]|uniref:cytochrome c-type biogenesis protein n=1 Tax=Rubellimicrobium sp. CFH 75288 TaxID=2697034 RepID=UPI001412B416|nr:cytochrome c-type biogenesis protein [Rubellimicrobium sp. CFH 75288]NAZ36051.1 cytochrome C biogenesis protein CcdA [Rubellimicrobium sp. CFH 75288]
MRAPALALAAVLLLSAPALAVQPDEILSDPSLEARARAISEGLRCPVCRNESIDESTADVARDMRLFVRERLVAGDSDRAVVEAVVARYGEYVLLRPTAEGANLLLWLMPAALLAGGAGIAWGAVRRRAAAPPPAPLSEEEHARLRELMGDRT